MNIQLRDEEQLQQYFDHAMSSGEEQNFLIDVAARNDMRMAFRSQLELLKAIGKDKLAMPGAFLVRERTMAALGLTAVMLAPQEEAKAAPSLMSRTFDFIKKPIVTLSLGLLIGSIGVYVGTNGSHVESTPTQTKQEVISAPIITQPSAQTGASTMKDMPDAATKNVRIAEKDITAPKKTSQTAVKTNAMSKTEPLHIVNTGTKPKVTIQTSIEKPSEKDGK